MAYINIMTEVSGLDSLNEDIKKAIQNIENASSQSLFHIGTQMQNTLLQHIENDIYSAYSPTVYLRRCEDNSLGTPLNDINANTTITTTKDSITMDYHPTGEHQINAWHTADGDTLIRRIESGQGYNYDFYIERPFWTNFVNELIDNNKFYDFFEKAMKIYGQNIENTGSSVIRELEDGNY